jgi:hypothetical protein
MLCLGVVLPGTAGPLDQTAWCCVAAGSAASTTSAAARWLRPALTGIHDKVWNGIVV